MLNLLQDKYHWKYVKFGKVRSMVKCICYLNCMLLSRFSFHSVPPRVRYIQGDLIVLRNRATTLTCKADGIPSPQISWFRRGSEIFSSLDGRIVVTSEKQLLIKFANAADEGTGNWNGKLILPGIIRYLGCFFYWKFFWNAFLNIYLLIHVPRTSDVK